MLNYKNVEGHGDTNATMPGKFSPKGDKRHFKMPSATRAAYSLGVMPCLSSNPGFPSSTELGGDGKAEEGGVSSAGLSSWCRNTKSGDEHFCLQKKQGPVLGGLP